MNHAADLPTMLNKTEFESIRIETYGITTEKRRVLVTHVGKRILDVVLNRREATPREIVKQAYNNVFYWVDELGLRSEEERDVTLTVLGRYWTKLSQQEITPSAMVVWENTIDGFRIRYTRHWHPNRFIVRTFCSVVVEGDRTPKRDGIVLEYESRHSVAYELPPNERPLPRDTVVGELLLQLKKENKGSKND